MVALPKGAQAAEQLAKESKGGSFSRLDFWAGLKDEDDKREGFLRFLTDRADWPSALVHSYIPVQRPEDLAAADKWPKAMWFLCQNAPAFRTNPEDRNSEFVPGYGHCYIHEHMADQKDNFGKSLAKPDAQTFALAVVRKPKIDQATNEVLGLVDEMVEWKDKDGNVHTVPHIVVVSQKWSNFFAAIANAAYIDKTVLDKDFRIVRDGNDYTISGWVTPDHKPGTPSWKVYEDTLALLGGFDLDAYLLDHSTPQHYARFLPVDGKPPLAGKGKPADDGATEASPAAAGTPDASDIASFADKLRKGAAAPAGAK